ncbi:MAG: hypothetical protein GXP63_04235 [DPANN group archaeon]|nr:hypothetical protein [DPANN group archaeon]
MEAQSMSADTANAGSQPEKKFRAGAISVSVWQNQGQSKSGEPTFFRTISLQRGYKDKEGNWKNTTSLRVNDLPKAALLMEKAYEHIVLSTKGDEE